MPKGMMDYGLAVNSWLDYALTHKLSPEEIESGLSKLARGELPEGANIAKAIVDGYTDGALILGAAYLGPAASVGKAVGGALVGAFANGAYQLYDLNQPGNETKTWDYWSSTSAAITGGLAPGRGIWKNVGIAAGGAVFTDWADIGSIGGSAAGAWTGGMFRIYAPGIVNSVTGKELPGFVYDVGGAYISEQMNNVVKKHLKIKKVKK